LKPPPFGFLFAKALGELRAEVRFVVKGIKQTGKVEVPRGLAQLLKE